MSLIAEDQRHRHARLASDEAARKDFAQDICRLLAVAEEARAHGVDKNLTSSDSRVPTRSKVAQFYFEELAIRTRNSRYDVEEFLRNHLIKRSLTTSLTTRKAKILN
jgi:hypothetical protein